MLGRRLVDFGSMFVECLSSVCRVCCWLGDIIGSFWAIPDILLCYAEVVLDNLLEFCKTKTVDRHIFQNRIAKSSRLNNTLREWICILKNIQKFMILVENPEIPLNSRSTAPRPLCYGSVCSLCWGQGTACAQNQASRISSTYSPYSPYYHKVAFGRCSGAAFTRAGGQDDVSFWQTPSK